MSPRVEAGMFIMQRSRLWAIACAILLTAGSAMAQSASPSSETLRRFVIERELPKIGNADRAALKGAAQTSNAALKALGPDIQWVESYVTADKTFCIYLARDEAIIRRHAEKSGFPANKITEVRRMIDPTTALE
jgi:hypothetical protein